MLHLKSLTSIRHVFVFCVEWSKHLIMKDCAIKTAGVDVQNSASSSNRQHTMCADHSSSFASLLRGTGVGS